MSETRDFNLASFPSVAFTGFDTDGYHAVGINDFLSEDEQALAKAILTSFAPTEDINWNNIATAKVEGGAVSNLYGGSIWRSKEGVPFVGFGTGDDANVFPLVLDGGSVTAGDASLMLMSQLQEKKFNGVNKKIAVPYFTIELPNEDTLNLSVMIQDDPGANFTAFSKLIKAGNLEGLAELIKPQGGKGIARIVDLVRWLAMEGIEIPQNGLEFKILRFVEVQEPPKDNPEWGFSVKLEVDTSDLQYPVIYKTKENILKTVQNVGYIVCNKSSIVTKTLLKPDGSINQQNFAIFTKMLGSAGCKLRITAFNSRNRDHAPVHAMQPGTPNDNVKNLSERYLSGGGSAPQSADAHEEFVTAEAALPFA